MGIGKLIVEKVIDVTADAVAEKTADAVGKAGMAASVAGAIAGSTILAAGAAAIDGVDKAKDAVGKVAKDLREKSYGLKRAEMASDVNLNYIEIHKINSVDYHKYEVVDSKERLLYYADEFYRNRYPDIVIYDNSQKIVGAIKRTKHLGKNILSISIDGAPFGKMTSDFHLVKDNYDVAFSDWTIESDLLKGCYTITDLEKAKIASIHYQKYDDGIVYAISVKDSQNIKTCIALAMAIDVCR